MRQKIKKVLYGLLILMLVIAIGFFGLFAYGTYTYKESLKDSAEPVAGMIWGNPQGTVTLVEFVDYRCPHCKIMNRTLQEAVAQEPYVKVIIRPVAWIDRTQSPAIAAFVLAAAKQGKGAELHEKILEQTEQPEIASTKKLAAEIGVDVAQAELDSKLPEIANATTENSSMIINMAGRSVPFLVIGGKPYEPREDENMRSVNRLRVFLSDALERTQRTNN